MVPLMDADEGAFINKTEFEVMCMIEGWREEENEFCEFCNSNNVEVQEIKVNDIPLFANDKIKQKLDASNGKLIMFNIDKTISGISLRQGGTQYVDGDFVKASLQYISNIIEERPKNNFDACPKGWFIISLTTKAKGSNQDFSVERFKTIGITKSEIYESLKLVGDQVGVKFPTVEKATLKSDLKEKAFKGSYFNKWFYAESLSEAEREGYPYANAYFDVDDTTTVAIGTGPSSPREFIMKNLNNHFIIDTDKKPLIRNGKTVYYAKKYNS